MSYCRWSPDSDVYAYPHVEGDYCCCACGIGPRNDDGDFRCSTPGELLEHLEAHRAAGKRVPERALERLRGEAAPASASVRR